MGAQARQLIGVWLETKVSKRRKRAAKFAKTEATIPIVYCIFPHHFLIKYHCLYTLHGREIKIPQKYASMLLEFEYGVTIFGRR